jgi:hypothetical protein
VGMPSIVGVGAAISGTGAVTAAFPGGYTAIADDVAWTWCECEAADTLTPPAGWAIGATQVVSSGTTTKLTGIYKRLIVGDTAPSIADAGDHIGARMIVVRDCRTNGSPINITSTGTELTSDTTVSIQGLTTTRDNCLIMSAFSTGQDVALTAGATAWANASLGSVTEQMDNWVTDGLGGGFAMATGTKAVKGVVLATTATLSLASNFKTLIMVALEGTEPEPRSPLLRGPRPSEGTSIAGPYAAPSQPSSLFGG